MWKKEKTVIRETSPSYGVYYLFAASSTFHSLLTICFVSPGFLSEIKSNRGSVSPINRHTLSLFKPRDFSGQLPCQQASSQNTFRSVSHRENQRRGKSSPRKVCEDAEENCPDKHMCVCDFMKTSVQSVPQQNIRHDEVTSKRSNSTPGFTLTMNTLVHMDHV